MGVPCAFLLQFAEGPAGAEHSRETGPINHPKQERFQEEKEEGWPGKDVLRRVAITLVHQEGKEATPLTIQSITCPRECLY